MEVEVETRLLGRRVDPRRQFLGDVGERIGGGRRRMQLSVRRCVFRGRRERVARVVRREIVR
jgi:hypothetical protein